MTAARHPIVAAGASAGGVEALRALAGGLPPDFPGTVLVVLHVPREGPSALAAILSRSGPLPASTAIDGEPLLPGHIYVAANDRHLLTLGDRLRLTRGPAENGHRPAADPLFRSVARAYGPYAIGVVLSGNRDDGAAGLAAIAARGGTTVVQDPAEALYPWMPQAALARVTADHVTPAAAIGGLLAAIAGADRPAAPGPEPADEQAVALEGALWMALHALEEKSALSRRLAVTGRRRESRTGTHFRDIADEADAAGVAIRELIARIGEHPAAPADPPAALR